MLRPENLLFVTFQFLQHTLSRVLILYGQIVNFYVFFLHAAKTNPLADIGVDFEAINRREKRMEKPTTTAVTSTVTMGKAMGSGSGMGRSGAGSLRPPPNPMMGSGMGMGMGMGMGNGPSVGMGMGGYGGMNTSMGMGMGGMGGMGMGQGYHNQMQPPTRLPPGSNIPGNYNNSMMGPGSYGQQPYGSYGQQPYGGYR